MPSGAETLASSVSSGIFGSVHCHPPLHPKFVDRRADVGTGSLQLALAVAVRLIIWEELRCEHRACREQVAQEFLGVAPAAFLVHVQRLPEPRGPRPRSARPIPPGTPTSLETSGVARPGATHSGICRHRVRCSTSPEQRRAHRRRLRSAWLSRARHERQRPTPATLLCTQPDSCLWCLS